MWFCMTVLKPHLVGVAGEVPILVYWADEGRVLSVNGQGPMPQGPRSTGSLSMVTG